MGGMHSQAAAAQELHDKKNTHAYSLSDFFAFFRRPPSPSLSDDDERERERERERDLELRVFFLPLPFGRQLPSAPGLVPGTRS